MVWERTRSGTVEVNRPHANGAGRLTGTSVRVLAQRGLWIVQTVDLWASDINTDPVTVAAFPDEADAEWVASRLAAGEWPTFRRTRGKGSKPGSLSQENKDYLFRFTNRGKALDQRERIA